MQPGESRTRVVYRRFAEPLAVLLAAVVGALLWISAVPVDPAAPALAESPQTAVRTDGLTLAVSPGTWTMASGSSARFGAQVAGAPDGCASTAVSLTWWLPGIASTEGFLNASSGPTVTFTSFASTSGGLGLVAVSGPVTLDCAGQLVGAWAQGSAAFTLLAVESVAGPFVSPNPATPGSTVVIAWRISGGFAPYEVTVAFGDGISVTVQQTATGAGHVTHRYSAGGFEPSVRSVDGPGNFVEQTLPDPLLVANGLVVAIDAPGPVVDAGRPFKLVANATGGVGPYLYQWSGIGANPAIGASWSLVVNGPGNFSAGVEVTDPVGGTAQASVVLQVVPPPRVDVSSPTGGGDVGTPLPVQLNLSGGVPPLTLSWSLPDNTSRGALVSDRAGTFLEPVTGERAGPAWVEATVTDALGAHASVAALVGTLYPSPAIFLSVTPSRMDAGRLLRAETVVTGGAPPFRWSVVTTGSLSNSTPSQGLLPSDGSIDWSAVPLSSGLLRIVVTVVDGAGVAVVANDSSAIFAPLEPRVNVVTPTPVSGSPLVLSAWVSGGSSPYLYRIALSDGEQTSGNLSAPGAVDFQAAPASAGYLAVAFSVTDGTGTTVNASAAVLLRSTPGGGPTGGATSTAASGAATATIPAIAGVGFITGIGLVLAFLRWRHRPPPSSTAGARGPAMGTVRRLLRESDGLERETLLFLAEEEGLSADVSQAAVDRWIRAGRVRSEAGTDGEVTLRWASESSLQPATDLGESE